MGKDLKRVSLMLRQEQYDQIIQRGINFSGLVRDLVDDHLSEHKVTIAVSEETKTLYDKIVSNTGTTDEEFEVYLRTALRAVLKHKIQEMKELEEENF